MNNFFKKIKEYKLGDPVDLSVSWINKKKKSSDELSVNVCAQKNFLLFRNKTKINKHVEGTGILMNDHILCFFHDALQRPKEMTSLFRKACKNIGFIKYEYNVLKGKIHDIYRVKFYEPNK